MPALFKFSQGIIIGGDGLALAVSVGVLTNIANVDDTGVASWQIELVDVPSNSSLVTGVIAFNDNSSIPAATFTPDVVGGSYRFILKVWSSPNRSGTPTDVDIRNVVVLDSNGFVIPPSQIWPQPLPPPISGLAGNKPDELNLAGQIRGWAGAGNDGLLDQRLRVIDSRARVAIAAGTQTQTSGTVRFSNSNGVSFGLNNGTLTASIQPGAAAGIGAVVAGTQTQTSGTLSFGDSNGISFGLSGSSRITASYTVPSTAGLISVVNFSAGTTSNNASAFTFSNSNNVSFGLNGSTITGSASFSQTVQTQSVVVPSAGTQTATSGTVVFANSNGLAFGMSGSSQITGSYTVPSTAGLISAVNVSAGTTSNNVSAVVFSNSNNVSFGLNGSTVTGSASFSQTVQTQSNVQGISAGTQVGRTGDIVFSNSNGISFGLSGSNTVTASYTVPTQTVQTQNVVVPSAGTQTATSGTVVFSNSNNVSFGMSGSSQITASIPAGATATGNFGALAAGTQTGTSGTVVLSDSNGISFGMSGSTRITASYTVPSTAGLLSAVNLSAGTTSSNASAFVFSNSNNVSFGLNGVTVTATISVPAQTNQTEGRYALGNTTGQSSSSTFDARTMSISGTGIVSVGYSGNALVISATQSTAPAAISAGTTQATNGTVVFSNSNGVSFGMNAGTITATVQPGAAAGIAAIQAGTQTATSGTVVFSDSNGISFGLSGSTRLTASYTVPATAGLISFVNLSAGTTSNNASAFTFSNSNGVSFGLNASTITASVATSLTNINLSAGTTSNNGSAFVFSNSNNVSFGLNGSTITATISVPAQTNQTEGRYAIGNTTGQSSSSTFDARTMSISGAGIASVGYSGNALVISVSAAQTVQTQNVVVPSAGTQTATSGTVIFSNSNGISFGMSNSSVITASYTVPTQTNQTVGLFGLGNTTQNSSTTLDARSLSFNGLGIVTVGYSNGSIQLSATQSVQTQSNVQGISAGTQVGRTGDIIFSNSNGISFGMSNSSVVTASYTVPSTAGLLSAINLSAGTTSNNASAFTFSNSNGVSFGLNASTITASVATSLTNVNVSAGTTSNNLSAMVFSNSNGVSFGLNGSTVTGSIATSLTNINFSAGTTSNNGSAFVFSNSNNVSFGLNGSTVTATITVPAQTNQTLGLFATSNTTQNSSTTLDARSITIQGAGIASVGFSNGSFIVSVPSGAPSPVNFSAGTTSSNLGSVVFSNSNGVSFGLNGATITASAAGGGGSMSMFALGNTTQNSSSVIANASVSFNALGAMSIGYSNGSIQVSAPPSSSLVGVGGISISTNGSTISISGPSIADFEPVPLLQGNTTSYVPGVGSWFFEPVLIPANLGGGHINRIMSFANSASVLVATTANFATGTTGSRSVSFSYANSVALYSLGAGTNSTRLESLWSNTFSIGIAQSVSVSSAAGTTIRVTVAATVSYIASVNSQGSYTTSTFANSGSSSSGSTSLASNNLTSVFSSMYNLLTAYVAIPIGFNTTITPGNYWLAQAFSSNSTTTGTSANMLSLVHQVGLQGMTGLTAGGFRAWGQTVSTSGSQNYPGQGVFSAATASPPSTIAFSNIRNNATTVKQYFNWVNSTL